MASITERFIICHDELKDRGYIKSTAAFAEELGTHRQTINAILKGRREVRIDLIQMIIEKYNANPYYLLQGDGEKFVKPDPTIEARNNNIKLVPIKAQAGYSDHILDPTFHAELPTYSLPVHPFKSGSYTSFEVEGNSMYPTMDEGDLLICSKLSPNYINYSIKSGRVYVFVTESEVIVKRAQPKQQSSFITCVSDNKSYKEINLQYRKIKEVWKVHAVLKFDLSLIESQGTIDEKLNQILLNINKIQN